MTTTIIFPDAGTGAGDVDGVAERLSVNETFANIRAGAGTNSDDTASFDVIAQLAATSTTDQYASMGRGIFNFDTSPIGTDEISSATFSVYGWLKNNGLGTPDFTLTEATPASVSAVANGDYSNVLDTSFGAISYASYTASVYNDLIINASGIASIDKSGSSSFAVRLGWDQANSFTGTWASSSQSRFGCYMSDYTGTTRDPTLTITHAPASTFKPKILMF